MTEHAWQRSSFCAGGGNNYVEIAATESNGIAIRESESPADFVATNQTALRALVLAVQVGQVRPPLL